MLRPKSFAGAAKKAASAAEDKKSSQIKLYDVRRFSTLADYYLILTVESGPHAQAVEDEIEHRLRGARSLVSFRREGRGRTLWRVLDFGGLVVHLMNDSSRTFYDLERLWESAKEIRWDQPSKSNRRSRPTR